MVRINHQAFWRFWPAVTDLCIRGKPSEGFESFGEVVSHQEGLQMFPQVLMGLVRVFLHGGFFEGSIHPFALAVRPRMIHLGQTWRDALLTAHTLETMTQGIVIAASVGQLAAVVGQHGVDLVRHGGHEAAQELRRHHLGGFGVPHDIYLRARPIDGHESPQPALFGTHLGTIEMNVANGVRLNLLLGWRVALDLRQAADSMALQTTRQERAC